MVKGSFRRAAAVSVQLAALVVTLGCEGGGVKTPTAPRETSAVPVIAPLSAAGAVSGTVTINGEARPIVWVELRGGGRRTFGTTIPNGGWDWDTVPAGSYVVVITTPPGLTCDALQKPATVVAGQRTVVNFACVGDVKGSIQGFAQHEFGTAASARITLTGPVNRDTVSNGDGFFAFADLPDGDYLIGWCKDPVRVSVRRGVTAYATADCS